MAKYGKISYTLPTRQTLWKGKINTGKLTESEEIGNREINWIFGNLETVKRFDMFAAERFQCLGMNDNILLLYTS